jgi:hypothetical protein
MILPAALDDIPVRLAASLTPSAGVSMEKLSNIAMNLCKDPVISDSIRTVPLYVTLSH